MGDGVDGPRRHRLCQNEVVADLKQRGPSVEQISRIGMDTSKHFFQLHGVNAAEKVVLRKKLRRKEMVCASAKTGRTYGRKRSDQSTAQITLRGGGRPHMESGHSL